MVLFCSVFFTETRRMNLGVLLIVTIQQIHIPSLFHSVKSFLLLVGWLLVLWLVLLLRLVLLVRRLARQLPSILPLKKSHLLLSGEFYRRLAAQVDKSWWPSVQLKLKKPIQMASSRRPMDLCLLHRMEPWLLRIDPRLQLQMAPSLLIRIDRILLRIDRMAPSLLLRIDRMYPSLRIQKRKPKVCIVFDVTLVSLILKWLLIQYIILSFYRFEWIKDYEYQCKRFQGYEYECI